MLQQQLVTPRAISKEEAGNPQTSLQSLCNKTNPLQHGEQLRSFDGTDQSGLTDLPFPSRLWNHTWHLVLLQDNRQCRHVLAMKAGVQHFRADQEVFLELLVKLTKKLLASPLTGAVTTNGTSWEDNRIFSGLST